MSAKIQKLLEKIREMGIVDNTADPRYASKVQEMAQDGLTVYHVVDGTYILGGVDEVQMTSYCFLSNDDSNATITDLKDGYAFANVVNPTWDIEEMGSIAFELLPNGMMARVG